MDERKKRFCQKVRQWLERVGFEWKAQTKPGSNLKSCLVEW